MDGSDEVMDWKLVPFGSVVGNLPEVLARDLFAQAKRHTIIEVLEEAPPRYVQTLSTAEGEVYVEVVADGFLASDRPHGPDAELRLIELGFSPPESPAEPGRNLPNWYWHPAKTDVLAIAKVLVAVLAEVFGLGVTDRVKILQRELA